MVLALLHESDLVLSDDVVEMIVDKVERFTLSFAQTFMCLFGIHIYRLILSCAPDI